MADPTQRISVEITAQTAQFLQEMARAASGAQAAAKKIETSFEGAARQAVGFGKSLLGALGISLTVGGLISVLESIKEKASEGERSINQLNAALIATGGAAGLTSRALEELGKSVHDSSIFSDEDIRKAETALLRFRTVQKGVFEDAIRLAPDVASALGVDIVTATQALGRALTDPTAGMRALKAAGLSLSEQQKDLAARLTESGDKAGAQKIVIDALRQSVGGASAADTKGLAGATAQLARAWGELEQATGKRLFEQNNELIKETTSLFEQLTEKVKTTDLSLGSLAKTFALVFGNPIAGLAEVASAMDNIGAGSRTSKGKIGGIADPAETDAFMKAANAKVQEALDAAYTAQKVALKRLAENSAAFYASETQLQKFNLDKQQADLEFAYSRGEITIEDFYDRRRALDAKAVSDAEAIINKQIELQKRFASSNMSTADEKQAAHDRAVGFADQADKLRNDRSLKLLALDREQTLAVEKLGDAYSDLAAKVAESMGDTATAASLSFEKSQRELRRSLETTAGKGGVSGAAAEARLADIDRLGKLAAAQAALNDVTVKYSLILGEIDVATARIDLQQQTGQLTEIGAINAKAAASQKYLSDLIAKMQDFAATVRDMPEGPVKDAGILRVKQMGVEIEKLAAQSDVLAAKFRDVFESNFADALLAVETRTKSLKDTVKDLAKSLEHDILQIANKEIVQKLFGKGGFFGEGGGGIDVGGIFAKAFGGGGAAGGATLTAAGSTLTIAGTGLTAAAAALTASAGALAASGAASGASSIVGGIPWTSGFDLFGAAGGTTFAPGGLSLVGERGPELVNLPRGAQVIPMDKVRRGGGKQTTNHVSINISLPGNVDTRSATQIAREASIAMQRALSRS